MVPGDPRFSREEKMQVTKHIHALKIPFQLPIAPGMTIDRFVYAYLIYGREITLIDSGVAPAGHLIFEYLRTTGREPDEIAMIVQTHSHPDHIGATAAIHKATGCTVIAHREEKAWIEDVDLQAKERPVPGFYSLVSGSVDVGCVLDGGEVLYLDDGLELRVFHTPGHSKGSISLLLFEEGALFSGDAIPLPGEVPIYEDAMASVRSIQRLQSIPRIRHLLASWDDPRVGDQGYVVMDESLRYLQRIHETVQRVAGDNGSQDPLEVCMRVQRELGLSHIPSNPLFARSFSANLKVRGIPNLLRGT
jgi:hydroxyacylglutathione hydrolase